MNRAHQMRRAALLSIAGAVTLSSMAGCSVASTSTTTALPVSAPASTSPGPATACLANPIPPTSPAPALSNTGTAWPKVIGSLLTYGQWLLANPNPALATTITQPGCASATALIGELQSLVDQRAYVQPSAPTLASVAGPYPNGSASTSSLGGQVTVDITATRAAEQVIQRTTAGAKGATSASIVLDEHAMKPPATLRVALTLGSDNRWRICGVTDPVNDPDGEAITTLL